MRHLENGNLSEATKEKHLLEEIQWDDWKWREAENTPYVPRYFKEVIYENGDKEYTYINDYWADRKKCSWDHMEDIFGLKKDRPVIYPEDPIDLD